MRQQVNLLPPDTEKFSRQPFSSRFLTASVVLVSAILILLATLGYQNSQAIRGLNELRETQARNLANLETLRARVRTHVASPDLQARIARTRESIAAHRALHEVLTGDRLGNSDGFSTVLVDLAERKPDALWLRQIQMDTGGQRIGLEGSALDPTSIPTYLQRLGERTSLAGRGVNHIEITHAGTDARHVDFIIRSEPRP